MNDVLARPRAFTPDQRRGGAAGRRRFWAGVVTAATLVAPASVALTIVTDAAPAAAAEISIPLADDVMTRMTTEAGWDGSTAANPSAADCVRYGSAPTATASGEIDNAGGSAGTEAAAWSDGATAWVANGVTAYSAHGRGGDSCPALLDLSSQSAVGFAPASIASVQPGVPFNLGRMVHRNNPVYAANEWFRGSMEVRLLGIDLSYAWQLDETPNAADPPADPANNDVVEFVNTVSEHAFQGPDGNRYTLVVSGFMTPRADGTCAPTLTDPGEAVNRFETVELTSTYGCLYAEIQQVRSLTVVKVATAAHSQPDAIPAFGFTTQAAASGSAWEGGFSLAPRAVGTAGAASVTRDIVVGETLTITEDPPAAPWSFTSLACVDGTGAELPIVSGAQITIAGDLSAPDAGAAPITCTYTNTYDPRGTFVISKTVTPQDDTPAAGYTGGGDRTFDIGYRCTLDGETVESGTAAVSIGAPATVSGLPVGAECAVTDEDLTTEDGDFADGGYRWTGYTVSSASAIVTTDAAATVSVQNRFVRDGAGPTPEPTPQPTTRSTPPAPVPPATPGSFAGALAVTGSGPVLPLVLFGAGLLAAGGITALLMRRRGQD